MTFFLNTVCWMQSVLLEIRESGFTLLVFTLKDRALMVFTGFFTVHVSTKTIMGDSSMIVMFLR